MESIQIHWSISFLMALVGVFFGGLGFALVSVITYRTRKLSSFLFGAFVINLFISLFFSWGLLYFIGDVLLDSFSFESDGLTEKVMLLSLLIALFLSGLGSIVVLLCRNIDGKEINDDLFLKKMNKTAE